MSAECQKPGAALCRLIDTWEDVGLPCCEGSNCLPWYYGMPHNFYCQITDIGLGQPCGVATDSYIYFH